MDKFYLLTDEHLRRIVDVEPQKAADIVIIAMALEVLEHRKTQKLGCEYLVKEKQS